MDEETLEVYGRRARQFAARDRGVPSPLEPYFAIAFAGFGEHPRILDIGAGSGRELAALVRARFDAWGIEPVAELREAAGTLYPGVADRLGPGLLPGLPQELAGQHDGVVCSAVLQHIPRARLFDAVLDIREVLREGGRALVAIPGPGRPGIDAQQRDELGRLFTGLTADELQLLFERTGFSCLSRWQTEDALGRPGMTWVTLLFERGPAGRARAIDRIASIISARERKVATYKLALLRALAEIAMTQAHRVRWRADGCVEVPTRAVAERWLRYYWPLCDPKEQTFLPQIAGDGRGPSHGMAFSAELGELQRQVPGGLGDLEQALRAGPPMELGRAYEVTLKKIAHAIRKGPVTYAGGEAAGLPGARVFRDEGDQILCPSDLWRELSLLSHWIEAAILLRWAELTVRLSGGEVEEAQVLGRLLYRPEPARDPQVRALYLQRGLPLRSVWSGRALTNARDVEVDHVIPWSLWHNNDLWNLVPAHRVENQQKRDELPDRGLVRRQRSAFEEAWRITLEAAPNRFCREASGQLGRDLTPSSAFFDELFDVMVESLEATRLQRGLGSWTPRLARAS